MVVRCSIDTEEIDELDAADVAFGTLYCSGVEKALLKDLEDEKIDEANYQRAKFLCDQIIGYLRMKDMCKGNGCDHRRTIILYKKVLEEKSKPLSK